MLKALATLTSYISIAALSGAAFAQQAPAAAPAPETAASFAQHKDKEMARITAHLAALQTMQSCVASAADRAAMKVCHKEAHASMHHPHAS